MTLALSFDLAGPDQTRSFGRTLGARLSAGDTLCLNGPLGAGKSELARAIVRQWLDDPTADVPSPTFTLVQEYEGDRGLLLHVDLYRLEDPEDAAGLGLEDMLGQALCLIEWPERAPYLFGSDALEARLSLSSGEGRHLALAGNDQWRERLAGLEAMP